MSGSLDEGGLDVKVVQDLQGTRVPKENAKAGVRDDAALSTSGGADMDAATKRMQFGKIREGATTQDKGAGSAVTLRHEVVDAHVVVKGVRPKIGAKIVAGEHGTKCVANSLVRAFAGDVLVRRVGTGQLYMVAYPKLLKAVS